MLTIEQVRDTPSEMADGLTIEQVRDVDAFGRWQASQVEAPRRSWWERMRMRFRRGP
jgi:hypothetical protein